MEIMDTMERTLHVGSHTGPMKIKPRPGLHKMYWPREFWRPVDAALHIGTPKMAVMLQRRKSVCADVFFFG